DHDAAVARTEIHHALARLRLREQHDAVHHRVGRHDERRDAVVPGADANGRDEREQECDDGKKGSCSHEGKIPPRAPVAQWIEQPPPKGQVARSIRVWGATLPPFYVLFSVDPRSGAWCFTANGTTRRTWGTGSATRSRSPKRISCSRPACSAISI